jgi:hypothetical protein
VWPNFRAFIEEVWAGGDAVRRSAVRSPKWDALQRWLVAAREALVSGLVESRNILVIVALVQMTAREAQQGAAAFQATLNWQDDIDRLDKAVSEATDGKELLDEVFAAVEEEDRRAEERAREEENRRAEEKARAEAEAKAREEAKAVEAAQRATAEAQLDAGSERRGESAVASEVPVEGGRVLRRKKRVVLSDNEDEEDDDDDDEEREGKSGESGEDEVGDRPVPQEDMEVDAVVSVPPLSLGRTDPCSTGARSSHSLRALRGGERGLHRAGGSRGEEKGL